MPRPELDAEAPWDARTTAALVVLVVACAVSASWLVHPWYEATRETADAAIYLIGARSILDGQGYAIFGEPFAVRPPGFSVLLAPVLELRGLDFAALNVLVASTGIAAVAAVFALARPRIGTAAAFALAILLWTNPGFRRLSNQVMSDVPGLALLLGCLVLGRWAGRSPSRKRDALLGLAIGLSAYVRSANVLLVPAEIVARFLRRDDLTVGRFVRERALVLAAVPIAILLPWTVRNALDEPTRPSDQTLLVSYSTSMWHEDGGDPTSPRVSIGDVLARVPARVPAVLEHLGGRLREDAGGPAAIGAGVLVVAALVAGAWRRRAAAEIGALLLLATLSVFPLAVDERLALPLLALGALAVTDQAMILLRRRVPATVARAGIAALLLALAAADFAPRRGWEAIREAADADAAFAAAVSEAVTPQDVLAAPIGWHLSVRLDRPIWNLSHAARREGFPGVERVIAERGVDAIVVRVDPPEAPNLLAALEARYGRGERVGPATIVRIR